MAKQSSKLQGVLADVLRRVTPSHEEKRRILLLADALVEKVKTAAKKASVRARVRIEGSVAKGTWLKEEPEIDIFMQLPRSTPRETLGTACLNVAKEATDGFRQVERFAEHPYLEAFVDSTRVNIVPCYRSKPGEWLSATDRTPFHTDYMKPKLNDKLRSEARLLKCFMKGIGVYGAEIKVGGFSGYLCELLTLHYGSFISVLNSVAEWTSQQTIDYEHYYDSREYEVLKIFDEPLIVVDPIDKGRNVASAVRNDKMTEFIGASRSFIKKPAFKFFYPEKTKLLGKEKLLSTMRNKGTALVFVEFDGVTAVPDILWGQLYRSERSLSKMLIRNDFEVLRSAVWSDEDKLNVFLFEVQSRFLSAVKKHLGPPISRRAECEDFLRKHAKSANSLSGPYLEDGRWIVEIKRQYTDIVKLLKNQLKNGGRQSGVAGLISKALIHSTKIQVNEQIAKTYKAREDFAKFLTEYLQGKPKWL